MPDYDRESELKAFDDTKAGVKGLVDAGLAAVPPFFVQPPGTLEPHTSSPAPLFDIPVIDLTHSPREQVVGEVRRASETFGFFQVVNHGVPKQVLDEMTEGVRRFNEQDLEEKKRYYRRDPVNKVQFNSNFDLFQAPVANWRETLFCTMAPEGPKPEELPLACREIIIEYTEHIQALGNKLFELLSEALGLHPSHLTEMECAKGFSHAIHYYPSCPQPHLALGTSKHSDPSFLTVLLQDHIGGLQVLHQNHWVDVPSVPGALVVNIGDLLQLISNDKLKSVEHRVLANKVGPRISVATFFSAHCFPSSRLYGPIKELLSTQDPPRYKDVLGMDFITHFNSKGLDGQSALDYFKL